MNMLQRLGMKQRTPSFPVGVDVYVYPYGSMDKDSEYRRCKVVGIKRYRLLGMTFAVVYELRKYERSYDPIKSEYFWEPKGRVYVTFERKLKRHMARYSKHQGLEPEKKLHLKKPSLKIRLSDVEGEWVDPKNEVVCVL